MNFVREKNTKRNLSFTFFGEAKMKMSHLTISNDLCVFAQRRDNKEVFFFVSSDSTQTNDRFELEKRYLIQ